MYRKRDARSELKWAKFHGNHQHFLPARFLFRVRERLLNSHRYIQDVCWPLYCSTAQNICSGFLSHFIFNCFSVSVSGSALFFFLISSSLFFSPFVFHSPSRSSLFFSSYSPSSVRC